MHKKLINIFTLILAILLTAGCQDKQQTNVIIDSWAPQEAIVGKGVNIQSNGKSALWIKVTGLDYKNSGIYLTFNNIKEEDITVSKDLITSYIPDEVLKNKGKYNIFINEPSGRKTMLGEFIVK